jgi:ribosomal protein S18 acetylase RimI-like enzyme
VTDDARHSVTIRRLGVSDVADYRSIRLAALQGAPEAFGAIYDDEVTRSVGDDVDRLATTAVFGAYAGGKIVGMAGFKQEAGRKNRHKGFVWGMYVQPGARRRGAAAALIEALLGYARNEVEQLILTVEKGNGAAIALYEKFGFETYGVEPRALKSSSGYADEVLMVRFLTACRRCR